VLCSRAPLAAVQQGNAGSTRGQDATAGLGCFLTARSQPCRSGNSQVCEASGCTAVSLIQTVASGPLFGFADARDRFAALESLASVPQPEALVRELHGRLVSASVAAGVPAAIAMDVALAGALLGREAANSFGVCEFNSPAVDFTPRVCTDVEAHCRWLVTMFAFWHPVYGGI